MERYLVIVQSNGTVYAGRDASQADGAFDRYVNSSQEGRGRIAGRAVTMLDGSELARQYRPELATGPATHQDNNNEFAIQE